MKTKRFLIFLNHFLKIIMIIMFLGVAFGVYITLFEIDGYNLSGVVEVSKDKRDLLRSSEEVQLQLNYPEDSGSYLEISKLNLHLPLNSLGHRILLVLTNSKSTSEMPKLCFWESSRITKERPISPKLN